MFSFTFSQPQSNTTRLHAGNLKGHTMSTHWRVTESLLSPRRSPVPQKSHQPQVPQGKNGTSSETLVKMPTSTFQMVTLIYWFMGGSSRIKAAVKVITSHLLITRNPFWSMSTFCMEIIQGNYSSSLPNETHWATYFPNFSFFLILVAS